MFPEGFLELRRVRADGESTSKKRALQDLAELLADGDQPLSEQIFDRLIERERLGSTGFGNGVALPHARLAGIEAARGAFIRLAQPVEFDALDGQQVDLLFALLVPEEATEEHLQLLAGLAKIFSDPSNGTRLRAADSAADILAILEQVKAEHEPAGNGSGPIRQPA